MEYNCQSFWIGIGCQKGTSKVLIERAIISTCKTHHLALDKIAGIATIDLKANEAGLVELCRDRNLPLVTFPAQLLNSIGAPNSASIVAAKTGTFSVAEAAAICAAKSHLIVPKQIFRQSGESGAVTIAIALAESEYNHRRC
jgi:cobalamin biosynthesis protein CbiG